LTSEIALDSVRVNHRAEYLGQRSFKLDTLPVSTGRVHGPWTRPVGTAREHGCQKWCRFPQPVHTGVLFWHVFTGRGTAWTRPVDTGSVYRALVQALLFLHAHTRTYYQRLSEVSIRYSHIT